MDLKEFLRGDTLLADRTRLVIMSTLAAAEEPVPFMRLLDSLELTRGNLASHLRKLEESGYVVVAKKFVERKPNTSYSCTAKGRKAVDQYLRDLEALSKGRR